MIFTVEDIHRLRSKWCDPVTVGELPLRVAEAMGLHVPLVYLSKESLDHINQRHSDVSDYDLILAPFVLKHGSVLREIRKPNVYLCFYDGPDVHNKWYGLVMKVAQPDRETYITSFHRVHRRQTLVWRERCDIIRAA